MFIEKLPSGLSFRVRQNAGELASGRMQELQELARALNVDQSAVSKLEHRTDMYVSTLRRCIAAMGGELEIRATFPQGTVRIDQFERTAAEE
jgi:hypothetical protein